MRKKIHIARDAFGPVFLSIHTITAVMVGYAAQMPSVDAVHGPRERRLGVSWMRTFVPGGAKGVLL
jgi:hypothetical protein